MEDLVVVVNPDGAPKINPESGTVTMPRSLARTHLVARHQLVGSDSMELWPLGGC